MARSVQLEAYFFFLFFLRLRRFSRRPPWNPAAMGSL
jgi:hypothetical protein